MSLITETPNAELNAPPVQAESPTEVLAYTYRTGYTMLLALNPEDAAEVRNDWMNPASAAVPSLIPLPDQLTGQTDQPVMVFCFIPKALLANVSVFDPGDVGGEPPVDVESTVVEADEPGDAPPNIKFIQA